MDVQAYQSAHVIRADPVSLPSSVDLSVDAPVPGDQGLQGSCIGWAVAYAVKTYHERIERGWPLTDDRHVMSPAYIYNQIKVPGGGAYFVDAFILLVNEGVSSWAQMPYDPFDDRSQPSARAMAEAANYKIADWGTVLRNTHGVFVQEIKRHLAAGTPLVVGIPVYPDFDTLSESNPVYDDTSGTQRGGHAVVIVGYDDRKSAFKIANSWGTDWGIGGYGWLDYDASEWLIWEIYVTEDVVASPDDEPPGAASDPRPGSSAISVALDTVLRWTRNARTTSFDVYLGTDANLRASDFQGSVAQAEFTPHLAPGSRYYWRIDARGAGGITQGSVWTFTTAGMLEEPGKAVNPSPADGATRVAQNTELSWDSGGRATSYDVYLGTDPVLGAGELQQTQATRTYHPRGLRAGTRYYWRIDAKNGQGTTTGDVWTFTTDSGEPGEPGQPGEPAGIAWRKVEPGGLPKPTRGSFYGVGWNGSRFVALNNRTIWYSVDGYTWQAAINPLGGTFLSSVGWNGSRFVAVGGGIVYSDDGIVWEVALSAGHFNSVTSNGFSFVAVGSEHPTNTGQIWYSADGITWAKSSFSAKGWLSEVATNGTRFVATSGYYGEIWHSADGITWTRAIGGPARRIIALAWGDDKFIADAGGELWHSPDGITWRKVATSPLRYADGEGFDGIMWNGTRFIGWGFDNSDAGRYGYIYHSPDGVAWTQATIEDHEKELSIGGVAGDSTRLVAVTNYGTFLTSP